MKSLRIALLAPAALALSGCYQYIGDAYLMRKDTAHLYSGESVAWNSAIQVPDPWPRHAYNTNIPFDGEKLSRGVKRYKEDKEYLPPTSSYETDKPRPDVPNVGGGSIAGPGPGPGPAAEGGAPAAGGPPGPGY